MKKRDTKTIKKYLSLLIFLLTVFTVNIGNAKADVIRSYDFDYRGEEQTFTVPYSGIYRLETWGAQGGNSTNNGIGGYGAYSVGEISLESNQKIYINVGGRGVTATQLNKVFYGGYNGGGPAQRLADVTNTMGSGGGATHMAFDSGILSALSSHATDNRILIVSGGGGGSLNVKNGGSGGGIKGNDGDGDPGNATGGTQTRGGHDRNNWEGVFGGASGSMYAPGSLPDGADFAGCGGGGGYYGGARGFYNNNTSAGGGSGYISNTLLTDKHMTCFNCQTSTAEATRTFSTTNHSETPTSDYAKEGHGYAKISLVKTKFMLSSLQIAENKGEIVEEFDPLVTNYTWIVPKNITEFTDEDVLATAFYDTSTVIIPESVPFTQDGDTFEITVIGDDSSRQVYTLTMQRYVSSDGRLASITSDKGQFKQEFDPDVKDYTLEIFEDADTVTIDAEAFEQDNQGITGLGEITLNDYEQDVQITSTAEDGTIEVYTVHIIKDMYLKNIILEGLENVECEDDQCILTPEFSPEKANYNIYVPQDYSNLNVTYIPSHEGMTVGIRANNKSYVYGQSLNDKKTEVIFNIYNSRNEVVKTYTMDIYKENRDSLRLKNLKVKKGHLTEDFDKKKDNYTWVIPKDTTELTDNDVIATLADQSSILNLPESVHFEHNGDTYIITVKKYDTVEYKYSGTEQVFEAPFTGKYKLETWGAQGGNSTNNGIGGYGAYSVGEISLESNQKIYINVGGRGVTATQIGKVFYGGYNGGGPAQRLAEATNTMGSGGGATHMAFDSGILSALSSHATDNRILIVSGGGGGSLNVKNGGSGGGIKGNDGAGDPGNATGGTQTRGGHDRNNWEAVFGGASGSMYAPGSIPDGTFFAGCGGGGGYYGGARGFYGNNTSAGGGSGYISNTLLTNKHMTCFNCQTSTAEATRTISTTNHSETPTSDYAKEGDGYAKITILDAEQFTKTYTLTMQREISDDARLATLTADKGIFTEEFDKDKDEYVLEMYHKETSVTFDATPFEQDATIIDGLGEIDLPEDETYHNITVQAEDGTIKIYTIIIRRDMYVEDLGLYGLEDLYCRSYECHMTPEFSPEIIDYEYRVPLDYDILDAYYEPASSEHRSEMTINGEPYVSGYVLPYTGTTVVQVNVYNDNDEIVKTYTMNVIKKYEYQEEFDYTGDYQIFIAPRTGKYQLETWGAQGGSASGQVGGYGSYSTGEVSLNKGDKLYVYVGGAGVGTTSGGQALTGGYNGGGSVNSAGVNHQYGSGGGATHIATKLGLLSSLSSETDKILIVSGGGGGSRTQPNYNDYSAGARRGNGGSGGGKVGLHYNQTGVSSWTEATTGAGSQVGGYVFGQGETATGNGAGGGGYYGGKTYDGSGSGGSGYIGNSLLSNKKMVMYATSATFISNEEATKTEITRNASESPLSDYTKKGNGYSKIRLDETETMLASLSVDDVTIVEPFDKFRTEYTWIIPKGVDEFTSDNIEAVLLHPDKAHIEWPSEPVQFTQDGDKFIFKVVADNGEEDTYTLTMVRYKSDDARLKSLDSDKGVISPEFNPDTNSYEIDLYEYLDSVTLDAETIDPDATIVSGIGEIELEEDIVEHEIIVTAEDGTTNVYNITFKKDAYLLSLGLNGLSEVPCVEDECTLVPPYERDTNEYSIKVPYEYETLDVYYLTATPEHSVKIKVGGSEVSNYRLPEGDTLVTVELYNKNNILVNTYTMNVNRAKGNYATLDNLEVSVGDLDIPFDKEITEYTWIIPFDVSTSLEDYISYTTTDPGATVELIPSSISYTGEGSKFDIKVTAEDGVTTKTYTITLQQDIIEDITVEENMLIAVGEKKNLYINGLPEGSVGKYLYEVDQNAIIFVYDNGDVYGVFPGEATVTISVKNHPEITPKEVHVTVINDKITSQVYDVTEKSLTGEEMRIIIGSEPGTTVKDYIDNVDNPNEYLEVYDKDDNLIDEADYEDTIVTTGMRIKLVINGIEHDEVRVIVRGDINQDGNINVLDMTIMKNHILNKTMIEGYAIYAADLVEKEGATMQDAINVLDNTKLKNYILQKTNTLND